MTTGTSFLGGGSGWSFKDMLPHFKGLEYNHQFRDAWHGVDGPLHVSATGAICQLTEDYILSVQGLGVPYNPDFNGARQMGVGTMQYTTFRNKRWNGVDAFLSRVVNDPKLTIETEATVSRLIIANGRCTGVAYIKGGAERTAHCEAEVLMAAGSYNTPKILMLSGIGPAAHLAAMGVTPVHDLPGVGENLQDHHEVPVVAATNGHFGYYGEDKGFRAALERPAIPAVPFRPRGKRGRGSLRLCGPGRQRPADPQDVLHPHCLSRQ